MPKYNHPIEDILSEDEVHKLYDSAKTPSELVLICLLWMTGARPSELIEMTAENVVIEDSRITFKVPTKKLHEDGQHFLIKNRVLRFKRNTNPKNIYIETIVKYVKQIGNGRLLDKGRSWMDKKINQMGIDVLGKQISPYHFRHSAVTRELTNGRDLAAAMHFKGSKNIKSVMSYAHARPYEVNMNYGDIIAEPECVTCGRKAVLFSTGECEICVRKSLEKPKA